MARAREYPAIAEKARRDREMEKRISAIPQRKKPATPLVRFVSGIIEVIKNKILPWSKESNALQDVPPEAGYLLATPGEYSAALIPKKKCHLGLFILQGILKHNPTNISTRVTALPASIVDGAAILISGRGLSPV